MAIAFVDKVTLSFNAASGTITLPAAVQGQDFLELDYTRSIDEANPTIADWTSRGQGVTGGGGAFRGGRYWRIAPGAKGSASSIASSSLTVTPTTSGRVTVTIAVWRDVDTTSPYADMVTMPAPNIVLPSGAGTSKPFPTVSSTPANGVAIEILMTKSGTAETGLPAPSGVTQRAQNLSGGGGGNAVAVGEVAARTTSGGTAGGHTWTTSQSGQSLAFTDVLREAAPADTTPPAAPTTLTATPGDGSVALDWADNTEGDLAGYRVYRSTTSTVDTGGTPIATPTSSAYTDTGRTNGTTYWYAVTAVDTTGNASTASSIVSATPSAAAATVAQTWIGDPLADGFVVTSKLTGAATARLAISTNSGMTSPTYVAAQTPDADGYVRHVATGLSPSTTYYYRLAATPSGGSEALVGPTGKARTLATAGTPAASFKVAFGSCQVNASTVSTALDDMRAWGPDFLVHLGDMHYRGSESTTASVHRGLLEAQISGAAGLAQALREVPTVYINSDHEAGPDNGDTNNAYSAAFNAAYKQAVPARLVDTANPPRAKYRSWSAGRIGFFLLDIRNLDRSSKDDTDNSSKTMLGATQKAALKAWLVDGLDAVKVIISDIPWMGAVANGTDKWWSYSTERAELGQYIIDNNVRVDFWHGDAHRVAVDATHNTGSTGIGGFPVLCGSAWDQTGGGAETNGTWDAFFSNSGGAISQYMRVTFTDDGTTITRTASGWDAINSVERVSQSKSWSTTTRVTKTQATGWVVRSRVSTTAASSWAVRSRVAKTQTTTWAQTQRVTRTLATGWAVRSRVARTHGTTWAQAQRVTRTQTTSWGVRSRVTATRASSWAVRERVTRTQTFSWAVDGPPPTRVTREVSTTWAVRQRVVRTAATGWSVRTRATSTAATSWGVRQRVTRSQTTSWNVSGPTLPRVVTTASTSWAVRARVVRTLSTSWSVQDGDGPLPVLLILGFEHRESIYTFEERRMRLDRDDRDWYWVRPAATVGGQPAGELDWTAEFFDGTFVAPHREEPDGWLGWLLAGPEFAGEDGAPTIHVSRGGRPRLRPAQYPESNAEFGPRIRMPVS